MKEHGLTYFAKNSDLAVDVVTILDCIRTKLQKEIKRNLCEYTDSFTPIDDDDTNKKKKLTIHRQ